eukprot:2307674-Pleurochrysis_carterae.AAC.1
MAPASSSPPRDLHPPFVLVAQAKLHCCVSSLSRRCGCRPTRLTATALTHCCVRDGCTGRFLPRACSGHSASDVSCGPTISSIHDAAGRRPSSSPS